MGRFSCIVLLVSLILTGAGCTSGSGGSARTEGPAQSDDPDTLRSTTAQDGAARRDSSSEVPSAVDDGILFFGNSITAGLGVSPEDAFPALVEDKIDSLGWSFDVVPAGVSGETSAGGRRRISWVMEEEVDVLVLELGGNDGLRGVPVDATRKNLGAIIDSARAVNPDLRVLLAGMQVPPNLGSDYTTAFKNMYPELASEKNVELIPFLLEGVGGVPAMNQSDGIHPNVRGHRVLAETVWEFLKPILQDIREQQDMSARLTDGELPLTAGHVCSAAFRRLRDVPARGFRARTPGGHHRSHRDDHPS